MDEKMLLYIVENFTDHENERYRKAASIAWERLKDRAKEIELEPGDFVWEVPDDARTSEEMLETILEQYRKEQDGIKEW